MTEEGMSLMKNVKGNKGTVVDIKPEIKMNENTKKTDTIERKTEAFRSTLVWESSAFEEVAALCNVDGTKLSSGKSKFRKLLISEFSSDKQVDAEVVNLMPANIDICESEKSR